MTRLLFVDMRGDGAARAAEALARGEIMERGAGDRLAVSAAALAPPKKSAGVDPSWLAAVRRLGRNFSVGDSKALARKDFQKYERLVALGPESHEALVRKCPDAEMGRLARLEGGPFQAPSHAAALNAAVRSLVHGLLDVTAMDPGGQT